MPFPSIWRSNDPLSCLEASEPAGVWVCCVTGPELLELGDDSAVLQGNADTDLQLKHYNICAGVLVCQWFFAGHVMFTCLCEALAGSDAGALVDCDVEEATVVMQTKKTKAQPHVRTCQ